MAGRLRKKPTAASKHRVRRVGFKDYKALAKALCPFVNTKYFTTYTSERDMKKLDRKKLQSRPFGYRFRAKVSCYCWVCSIKSKFELLEIIPVEVLPGGFHCHDFLEPYLEFSRHCHQEEPPASFEDGGPRNILGCSLFRVRVFYKLRDHDSRGQDQTEGGGWGRR